MLKIEEHIARLIFLYSRGMTDASQESELLEWRNASPRHEALFRRMISCDHVERSLARFVKTEDEMERGWELLQGKINAKGEVGRTRKTRWFPYAAAIGLFLAMAGGILYYTDSEECVPVVHNQLQQPGSHAILVLPDGNKVDLKNEDSRMALARGEHALSVSEESLSYENVTSGDSTTVYHTLKVPRGGEYVIMLSDSTKVYLNADSWLRYPVSFQGKERKVYLSGEAYFKVKRNERKPFVVEAEQLEVEVLGTTFCVRAYKDEQEIQTTLESGNVLVRAGGKSVNLVPDKQALFDKRTLSINVRDVDVNLFLAWKDGRLVYDNCPLEKILTDLGRWYAFDVFYSRDELRSYKFSLNMRKHEAFTQVLDLMEKTGDIHFEIKDKVIIVK